MKHPSKKQAAMINILADKQRAIDENDVEAFAEAVTQLKELETQPHTYLCVSCNHEFPDGKHVDLLVASIVVYNENGEPDKMADYGITSVTRETETIGRRLKFCNNCVKKWKNSPIDYAEIR